MLVGYTCPDGHYNRRAEGHIEASGRVVVECGECGDIERFGGALDKRRARA